MADDKYTPPERPAERVPGTEEHLGSDRPYEGATEEETSGESEE